MKTIIDNPTFKRFIIGIITTLLASSQSFGQLAISSSMTSEITVNGSSGNYEFSITNNSNQTQNNILIDIDVPTGIEYIAASIGSVNGYAITESNSAAIQFNLQTLEADSTAIFNLDLSAACSAIDFQLEGGIFRNTIKASYTGYNTSHQSNPYNILYAALSILDVSPKNVSLVSGQTVTRTISVINGGNGSIDNFIIVNTQSADVNLIAASVGTLNGNQITLSSAELSQIGNGDGNFDQDEIIDIAITYEALSCTDKTVTSTIEVGWMSTTGFCQNSFSYANTSIDFSEPVIEISTVNSLDACADATTGQQQSITLTNTGDGVAANLVVDIFKSSGDAYDEALLSKFEINSITYSLNGSAFTSIVPASSSATSSTGEYACLGTNAIGQFLLEFEKLEPDDEITIMWDMYTCCASTCGAPDRGGWKTDLTYADVCAGASYSASAVGQSPANAAMIVFTESEPDITNGARELYTFVISTFENSFEVTNDSRIELLFTIPAGLKLADTRDIVWTSAPSYWNNSLIEYNQTTGDLRVLYALPEPFNLPKTEIQLYLTADCAMADAPEGNKTIALDINLIRDINCASACPIPLVCNTTINTLLHCPSESCADGGIRNLSYDIYRTSYGKPDLNEDGYPDATGALDFNKIKTNRVMFGDTLKAAIQGIVHSGAGISQWNFGYGEVFIEDGQNTQLINATIRVFDASSGNYLSAQPIINRNQVGKDVTYKATLTPSTLGSTFQNFAFEAGDSVFLEVNLQVVVNIGGNIHEVTTSGKMYLSETTNPVSDAQYYCHEFLDNITFIGYFYAVWGPENYTVKNCETTIRQEFLFSIGNCCNNFGGGNLFPYEYRNWSSFATAKVVIPTHYTINSIDLQQYYTRGTNQTSTQTVRDISNDYRNRDTLIFDLSQYYDTDELHRSDDGFSGQMFINLSPSCDIPENTFQDIYWAFNFNDTEYLSGNTTQWYSNSPDRIRYIPRLTTLSSSNPVMDGLSKTVTWDVKVKNNSWNDYINHPWMYLISPTNDVTISHVIDKSTQDTLNLTNNLYQLDTLNKGENRTLEVTATYAACTPEKLIVYSGYSCETPPATYADVKCDHNNMTLSVVPKPAQLQVQISGHQLEDCSPLVEVELLMASVRLGSLDSLNLWVTVPNGQSILSVDGFTQYAYPNTGSYSPFSDPNLEGLQYHIPVHSLDSYVAANGLPGVTNVGQNKISVKMLFEMQNNFVPGDHLQFTFESKRACNEQLPQINLAFDPSIGFEDIEIDGLTTEAGDNWSGSWGDFNNDGFDDLFVTEYSTTKPNSLYKNNGDKTFTKVTTGAIVTDLASSIASSWADYDNDGDLDLFVANNIGSPNFLYQNNGDETFTKITSGHIVTYDGYSHGATWADYNLDGYLDLFVSDFMPTRVNLLYKNLENGSFELITSGDITAVSAHSIGASWADVDGDGDPDLFVPNAGENNFFYRNSGGELSLEPTSALMTATTYSTGGSWGDFDNDGDLDLFVANGAHTANQLYVNDGTGTFTATNGVISQDTKDSHGSTWIDVDNDGDLDLFVTNDRAETNQFYTNNGDGTFSVFESGLMVGLENSFGTAIADIENDGDLDLFIANHSGEENVVFNNTTGSCENSFCATLVGTTSNRTAVGAKVTASASIYGTSKVQTREVSTQTGGGSGSQNSMKIHFGLGDATQIDLLRIEWPSGVVQQIINQPAGECITIYEETGSLVTGTAYLDDNQNCIQDAGELTLAHREIVIAPLGRKVYTDKNGNYQTYLIDGEYTLASAASGNFSPTCAAQALSVTGTGNNFYAGNDFGFSALCASPDLEVVLGTAAMRRGFGTDLFITIKNKGGATANNVALKLHVPEGITPTRASTAWNYELNDTLYWYFGEIEPEQEIALTVRDSVTLALLIGDRMQHTAQLTMDNLTDCNLENNSMVLAEEIVGAIDPNDKQIVFSDGYDRDYALKNEVFTYKIRFQNIGTYYATRVIIKDTLDHQLDISAIDKIISSHTYKVTVEGRVVTWVFDNINLPAAQDNEEGSHGFVSFQIKSVSDAAINSVISNTANIQFDFEAYIATNEVSKEVLSAHPRSSAPQGKVHLSPNPATGNTTITLWNTTQTSESQFDQQVYFSEISVLTVDGKIASNHEIRTTLSHQINISQLAVGMYLIQVKDRLGNVYYGKLIKN